tara:strand:- start:432 stop:878 length:447 start_codon:yes stop_codon:yes gene_type:complete
LVGAKILVVIEPVTIAIANPFQPCPSGRFRGERRLLYNSFLRWLQRHFGGRDFELVSFLRLPPLGLKNVGWQRDIWTTIGPGSRGSRAAIPRVANTIFVPIGALFRAAVVILHTVDILGDEGTLILLIRNPIAVTVLFRTTIPILKAI